jgi:hypothetical protein
MNEFSMVSANELSRIEGGGFWSGLENDLKKLGNDIENAVKNLGNDFKNAPILGGAGVGVVVGGLFLF